MAPTLTEMVLDHAHDAVISMDRHGLVTYWNPSAERMLEIRREQALGRAVADLIVPEQYRDAHRKGLERFLADGTGAMLDRRVELTALRGDEREIPIEMTITAVRSGSEWLFTAFLQDISERLQSARERERLVEELRQTLAFRQRRFDAVVGSLADPITIRDRSNRIVYANQVALRQLGFSSLEALRATPPEQIMARYLVEDEDGNAVSMDQIPSVRLLRGEVAEPLLVMTVDRTTHAQRWSLLKASPLLDARGQPEMTIMVIEDVTEQKRAERRAEFMAQASSELASSLDYEQTLRNVAALAVPGIADWCVVDLVDTTDDHLPVAAVHAGAGRTSAVEELRAHEAERLAPTSGLGRVLRTGVTVHVPRVTDEPSTAGAMDNRRPEFWREIGFRSVAIVPMRIGSRTLGAMTFVDAESGRLLDRADVELAEQIAARAAIAVENARLYSERAMIAHTLQQSLLPARLPEIPGYELASLYLPAVESAEVGGDFYDAWVVGESWIVAIGDVTGKGVQAAALTSLARHTLRATAEFITSPAELLRRLDLAIKRDGADALCTAACLRLDGGHVTIALGGHPLPIHIDAHGTREVGQPGPLLGGLENVSWEEVTFDLAPGGSLLLFTDGVTDARRPDGERFGPERLEATFAGGGAMTASAVVSRLTAELDAFQIGEHADDTTALVLHRLRGGGE